MRPFTYTDERPGVWATRPISQGETIDEAPVVVMPAVQGRLLAQTALNPVLEQWPNGRGAMALALGSVGVYRRGPDANARVTKRVQEMVADVVATRNIHEGEEIVVEERSPSRSLRPHPFWSSGAVAYIWRQGRYVRRRGETIDAFEVKKFDVTSLPTERRGLRRRRQ